MTRTRTSGNSQSLLTATFVAPIIGHESKAATSNKSDDLTEVEIIPTSETLSRSFSDNGKDGTKSKPNSTSSKNHDPVKRIIRKVLNNVEGISEHVDSVLEFQMRRQSEEMLKYFDHQLHKIEQDIRAAEVVFNTTDLNVLFASSPFSIKRINNNRASRLSRLKKKKRIESTRLESFCYNQFNEDLERESRRLRAKFEKQLQFLAEAGVDVDAEILLRAKIPETVNELRHSKAVSTEYLSLSSEYPSVSGEYLSLSSECPSMTFDYLSVSSEPIKDENEYNES